ncbi:class I SAM-dependent methyltransferase, partial [Patescibacteria group bacterium]|nr:class I SAM-dependent methyltransferase [Patescibacteria group bacterium]
MDEENILELSEQEKLYWWHISRRSILQSVLDRFRAQFFCYPDLLLCHPERSRGISEPVLLNSSAPSPAGESAQNDIRILDVGCGTGENFYWLSKFGEVTGADTSELAVELADQKGKAVLGRTEDLPFEDGTFDLVTAFDVLEHVTDDAKVLQEWKRVLHSGGRLFLSVPAYQGLFGPHDRALGHLRRYNL